MRMHGFKFDLPIVLAAVDQFGHFSGEVHIDTYRQLFDFIGNNKAAALYHFKVLHGEIEPNKQEGEYHP